MTDDIKTIRSRAGDETMTARRPTMTAADRRQSYILAMAVGADRERRRLRTIVRQVRAEWQARLAPGRRGFQGAARAVQALDEVLRLMRGPGRQR